MGRIWTRPRTPVAVRLANGEHPQGAVVLNRKNPITRGAAFCAICNGAEPIFDTSGSPIVYSAAGAYALGVAPKMRWAAEGATASFKSKKTMPVIGTGDYTIAARVICLSDAASNLYYFSHSYQIGLGQRSGQLQVFSVAADSLFSGISPAVGDIHTVVACRKGTERAIYIDGVQTATDTQATNLTDVEEMEFFAWGDGAYGLPNSRGVEWGAFWPNRCLSDSEIKELHEDRYCLFAPANDAPFRYLEAVPPATGEDNAIFMGSNF